MNKIRRFEN